MRDINDILSEWPYDPSACLRKVQGADGREIIQVRTPLGVEQYELEGRPDGVKPYGEESVLEHVESQVRQHIDESGETTGFVLNESLASELQQEGALYYYRYLVCFQIGEYELVARDTQRNLRMFDVIKRYCESSDTINESEQYRPYVMRMLAAAQALLAINRSEYAEARSILRRSIRTIAALPPVQTATFEYEKKRSLAILRGMVKALPDPHAPTKEEALKRELREAITEEDYERAARIRDEIRGFAASHHEGGDEGDGAERA